MMKGIRGFTVHGSRFTVQGGRGFTVHGSGVHGSYPCGAQAVQGSRFTVHGSRFTVQRFRVQRFRGLTIHHPPSTIHHPLSTIHYPLSTIHHPLSPPALNIDRFSEYGIKVTA
jgi:hypothetical protein